MASTGRVDKRLCLHLKLVIGFIVSEAILFFCLAITKVVSKNENNSQQQQKFAPSTTNTICLLSTKVLQKLCPTANGIESIRSAPKSVCADPPHRTTIHTERKRHLIFAIQQLPLSV